MLLHIGAVLGSVVYNKADWGWGLTIAQIYVVNGIVPAVLVLPVLYPLIELAGVNPVPTLRAQAQVSE